MAGALAHISWESCLIDPHRDRALETYARRKMGMPFPPVRYFTRVPWVARAMVDLHPELGLLLRLDAHECDILTLVISQENSCRFCYAAIRALLWIQGMSEARIQRIEQRLSGADLTPRLAAVIAFGRRQSRVGPEGAQEARQILRDAGVGDDEMKELAFVVGVTDFTNRLATITAMPPQMMERMPERVFMRPLRPLLKRIMERQRSRGQAVPLARVPSYAYARLVKAYAGSPIAPTLSRIIEEMWDSPTLTRRSKLLMLAVIARGLNCDACAGEIGEALQREGLDDAALHQVLTHLDAPELDDAERLLVRFARETIWYEPATLQRRARALGERLSPPQLTEAIAVAALANGLCRMGAIVMGHA